GRLSGPCGAAKDRSPVPGSSPPPAAASSTSTITPRARKPYKKLDSARAIGPGNSFRVMEAHRRAVPGPLAGEGSGDSLQAFPLARSTTHDPRPRVGDRRPAADPAARPHEPGGVERLRGPLRPQDPALVPPLAPPGGRRPRRHADGPDQAGAAAPHLRVRPR